MIDDLTSRTVSGLKWSYVATAVNAVLQIGFTAVLARLLEPTTFGLVAMGGIVLRFGSYFAQLGVGPALIQKQELSIADIRAAFTSSFVLGLGFAGLTYVVAPFAILVFNAEAVIPVIRVMSLAFLLGGISTTSLSLLRRALNFRALAIIEMISYVFGYGAIGVALALLGFGVWSLVIAGLSQISLTAILGYLYEKHPIGLLFNWRAHRSLVVYGSRLSFISFLEFIGFNVDNLIIGRRWGAECLGVYTRSFSIVNLPTQYLGVTLAKVMFPSFSRLQSDAPRLRRAYYTGMMLTAVLVLPVSLGMIPAARELVLVLLGDKWTSGIIILQILAVLAPFNMGTTLPAVICDSLGRLGIKLLVQGSFVSILLPLILLGSSYGVVAIAGLVVIANLGRFIAYQVVMHRVICVSLRDIWRAHLPGVLISAAVMAGIFLVRFLFHQINSFGLLGIEILTGALIFLQCAILVPPKDLRAVIYETLTKLEDRGETGPWVSKLLAWYRVRLSQA